MPFTIELHLQSESLEWLEPLARHLGHVEIAIDHESAAIDDANVREHSRQPHPVVNMIDEAEREERMLAKRGMGRSHREKLEREAERKRRAREIQKVLTPKVIDAVYCMACAAAIGEPCEGPSGIKFGRTGHTHLARREAYANQATS